MRFLTRNRENFQQVCYKAINFRELESSLMFQSISNSLTKRNPLATPYQWVINLLITYRKVVLVCRLQTFLTFMPTFILPQCDILARLKGIKTEPKYARKSNIGHLCYNKKFSATHKIILPHWEIASSKWMILNLWE